MRMRASEKAGMVVAVVGPSESMVLAGHGSIEVATVQSKSRRLTMKITPNVRAGKKSGTVLSNSDLGISGGNGGSATETEATTTAPAPVVYTRCVGI